MEIEQERHTGGSYGIHFGYQLFPTVQLELATGATNGIHVGDYFEFGITIIHSDRIFPLNGENGMRRKFDFFSVPFEMKYPVKRNPTLKELEFSARMFKFKRGSCDKDIKMKRKGMNKERAYSMSNIFAEKGCGCGFVKENKMKKGAVIG
jgi:hypothetical protein